MSSPPRRPRVDDKAAQLEVELERLKKKTDNGKYILAFTLSILGLAFASVYIPVYAFIPLLLLTLVMLTALAFHWDFPEVRQPLSDMFHWAMRDKGKGDETPPSSDEE